MLPQSKYLPEKLWAINLLFSFINSWIASVIWISPLLLGLWFNILKKIFFDNIYLPITALFDGDLCMDGFSTTSFIR